MKRDANKFIHDSLKPYIIIIIIIIIIFLAFQFLHPKVPEASSFLGNDEERGKGEFLQLINAFASSKVCQHHGKYFF